MKYKIKDICKVINGRAYKQDELLPNGKYKVLRVGNFFSSDRWYYSNLELSSDKYCDNGDLLFAWSATFGPKIWDGGKVIYHYHIWKLVCDENKVDKYFLYYWLLKNVKNLKAEVHGSVMGHITKNDMENYEIDLPSLEIQHKIVSLLKGLDDKIKINEEINKNLHAQARTIYAHMIIDEADDSWHDGLLSDIATITMGQSPKGDTYNENGTGSVLFQGRAEFGFRFPTRRLFTTDPKRMAQTNDVLMSVRAPVGDINVAYEDCCIGRGLGAIHSKDNHQSFVLYTMFALRNQLDVFNGEGTVFGSINRDALNSMPISIPPLKVIDQFEDVVSPMDDAIRNNYEQSCHLQAMRDILLPRLMSGELDVSDIDL